MYDVSAVPQISNRTNLHTAHTDHYTTTTLLFFSQYFSGVDQYFVAGVETLWEQGFMPLGMKVDKHYYLDRLSKVRAKYNFNGTMTNVRQVQLPPVTNDGEKPWKAAAIALGSVLATVLIGAAVVWVVRRASGNAGGVEVATHQL